MQYILALDQGTTSSRALLFDTTPSICSISQREFPQGYPHPGWVEHDAMEIYASQYAVMEEAVLKADISVQDIAAIAITNQRETTVVWNRHTGRPIAPAIVWQCRRTAARCEELKQSAMAETIRKKTGLIVDAYFSATKIEWILDHVPGARAAAEQGDLLFGTIDTWLVWKLTGGKNHVTDYTNAARTMLFNIHTLTWDEELLSLFRIPKSMMPAVQDSSSIFGYHTFHGVQIPIAGIAGDQQASLFGHTCFHPGEAKSTYGTGCFLLMNTGDRIVESKNGLLTTIAIGRNGHVQYALEGSVFVAGAAIQWLRDELQLIKTSAEASDLALTVPDTAGLYLVPAFTGLGAPYWDMFARGCLIGITRGANRAHLARAALESIAYQCLELVEAMEQDWGAPVSVLQADGGASQSQFLMQFQADLLRKCVIRPQILETTALGAAFLAGLAVGIWKDTDELVRRRRLGASFTPSMEEEARQKRVLSWKKAVSRSLSWAEQEEN